MSEKLEKVKAGLEACSIGLYCPDEECPYAKDKEEKEENCIALLARDALEVIEALETHVMTLEEVEDALDTVVWVDRPLFDNTSNEYALIDAYSRKTQMVELRYPFSDKEYRERADYAAYGKNWRCWNARPTDEQREAVKWDG